MNYFLIDLKLDKIIAQADYYGELSKIITINPSMIIDADQAKTLGYFDRGNVNV